MSWQGYFYQGRVMILAVYSNQADSEFLATIISGLILAALVFGLVTRNFAMSDRFDIGYVDTPQEIKFDESKITIKEPEVDELKLLKRQVEIAKLKKQLAELETPSFDNELIKDCIDALVGLGVPARKAKADVQNVFDQNPNIKTVQQFITEYGKRCA